MEFEDEIELDDAVLAQQLAPPKKLSRLKKAGDAPSASAAQPGLTEADGAPSASKGASANGDHSSASEKAASSQEGDEDNRQGPDDKDPEHSRSSEQRPAREDPEHSDNDEDGWDEEAEQEEYLKRNYADKAQEDNDDNLSDAETGACCLIAFAL